MVLGTLSGLSAPLPVSWRYAAVVAVALLGVLRDAKVVSIPLPQNARQVPQDVLRPSPRRGALQFGFELGTGVRTYLSATAPYVLAVAVLLAGQRLQLAALAGVGFGAGRAVTPLIRRASGAVEGWDSDLPARLRTITVTGCAALAAAFALLFLPQL
ncbi:hypothetical protein GA0074696_3001 [Micromonospora purpureochromogenes]|uniref:Uncharacterized protein n=1 Tax=Micromonospora purpureochromogenes TaxID=47872 RepID=A0A1C4Y2G3_9ACTN|nr:hypothetical protein [Micromonospora purpureochromogenes]SCF14796.1 hypothetical protein GA0074696_3001 [Micromonospora purpureochromogenes]